MNLLIKRILLVGSILLLNACIPPPFLPHPGSFRGGYSGGQPGYYGGNPGYNYGAPHWGGHFSERHHHHH
ncbi:MAG: hypothetical protein ABL903_16855 [Methylococcales bacterium]